eukprot:CAMPEP_0116847892 /NCGR_PEP_ID=MMETSP0418-20121206/14683_1 /TAXON_ID=1158023 /ORGANISM="Astrosyne radiata, Strain 13vi08-1A" /LENGTH=275 /DNA_ID=CAMNT_0004479381 /DNA_START=177 /DNA_END=1004 /DNA_ORIENTATION=+
MSMATAVNMPGITTIAPTAGVVSPRNGATAAPVNHILGHHHPTRTSSFSEKKCRRGPLDDDDDEHLTLSLRSKAKSSLTEASVALAKARSRNAQKINSSHDDIISKSFHGRHGRAYLFDQCVNVTIGPAEDRVLITGLHSVCDIFCKRCKSMVGWTYAKAYESSQKYKEGKYIIEKINLHLEESYYYNVHHPAGERTDKWRVRSMSWGNYENNDNSSNSIVYEYYGGPSHSSLQLTPRGNGKTTKPIPRSCPTMKPCYSPLDRQASSPLPTAPAL